ncbi:MAG: N-acetylglucosamine kinase [Robiginitomaculum sp.]|nr:MAG: N-acetylglucosamine kinase [Robiginitomaculum sp.]
MGSAKYFLGIDAGGSTCRARLSDEAGAIIGQGKAGPANARIGIDKVFCAIEHAYNLAIEDAKLDQHQIASIRAGMGIAGINRIGAKEALLTKGFPFASVIINTDGYIANIGAHGGKDGGIVIIGTGSIALGHVMGADIKIGGYGFPISDEGSGAYIGLQAIRKTLHAADRRSEHSDLTRTLFNRFENQTDLVVRWMDGATATDYAALAPLVTQAAKDGDPHGRVITQHAAHHIEMMIRALYKAGVPRCALLGGLSALIMPWLSPDVRAMLVEPAGDALDGALQMAHQHP